MSGHRQGFALPLVLVLVALLAVMSMGYSQAIRGELQGVRHQVERFEAQLQLDAALQRTLAELANARGQSLRWRIGQIHADALPGAPVLIRLIPTSGLVDINRDTRALLAALLRGCGMEDAAAQALLDQLQDWRDADSEVRLNGAELAEYRQLGRIVGPTNAPMTAPMTLRALPGMSDALLACLLPHVKTVYSEGQFNARLASEGLRTLLQAGGHALAPRDTLPPLTASSALRLELFSVAGDVQKYARVHVTVGGGMLGRIFGAARWQGYDHGEAPPELRRAWQEIFGEANS